MYKKDLVARVISKKLSLHRKVVEQYTHQNITCIPSTFIYTKPILILDQYVLEYYNTILFVKNFDFIILDSHFKNLNQHTARQISRLKDRIMFFCDLHSEETADKDISHVLYHLQRMHPDYTFDILTKQNIYKYTENCRDILFCNMLVAEKNYPENIESLEKNNIVIQKEEDYERNIKILKKVTLNEKPSESCDIFEEHLTDAEYLNRLGEATLGTLMVNFLDNTQGEVLEKNSRTRLTQINRAFHGDEVFVKDGKIIGISKIKTRVIVGSLYEVKKGDLANIGIVKPIDSRFPEIKVYTHYNPNDTNIKVKVHIKGWEKDSLLPHGIIFETLGKTGNMEDEIKAIQEQYNIDYFSEGWLKILNTIRTKISKDLSSDYITSNGKVTTDENDYFLGFDPKDYCIENAYEELEENKRVDLRHLDVCSIDPLGCTDIDDALHCKVYDDFIEVGVHIADVSLYVKEGSVLDIEAKNRSTTVYFTDRRIDMLPAFLSSDLCSLLENKDRAAFSCVWKFDKNFKVIDKKIFRSIIRSRSAFTYEEAFDIINGKTSSGPKMYLKAGLAKLLDIATKLRAARFEKGALELNSAEIYIGKDKKVKVKESIPTHYLVEEFMLLANITVARFIYDNNAEYSLLRKHPLPSAIELDMIDSSSSAAINASLKKLNEEQRTIIKRLITRSMQQAIYFCSGESSDFQHYGLATPIYTHFTSPIRRYPDILVHRTLSYIIYHNDPNKIDFLSRYVNKVSCSFMNFRHRNSQNASRLVSELFMYSAIEEKDLDAVVVSAKKDNLVIFIREYGIEARVNSTKQFKAFDEMRVRIHKNFDKFCLTRRYDIEIL